MDFAFQDYQVSIGQSGWHTLWFYALFITSRLLCETCSPYDIWLQLEGRRFDFNLQPAGSSMSAA